MSSEAILAIERKEDPSPSSLQAPYVRRLLESYDEEKAALALEALRPSWHVAMSDARYAASTLGTKSMSTFADDDQRAGAE